MRYCHTVVRLGARKFRGRGIGLFVTWWKDLGDGRAGDEKWASLARPLQSIQPGEGATATYSWEAIVDAFEEDDTGYFDFDGLSSRASRKELFRLSPYRVGVGK